MVGGRDWGFSRESTASHDDIPNTVLKAWSIGELVAPRPGRPHAFEACESLRPPYRSHISSLWAQGPARQGP
jgi:hypothetical protein